MRTLEIRRHSLRKEGAAGSQLSQAGVDLARELGASMGPFARVATSVVSRARETAIAIGFAVDLEIIPLIGDDELAPESEASRWWLAERPFAALAELVAAGGATARFAEGTFALWRDLVLTVADGEAALVIGHSGQLETALVGCFPSADHGSWGAPFAPLEGARLGYDGEPGRFVGLELIRLA